MTSHIEITGLLPMYMQLNQINSSKKKHLQVQVFPKHSPQQYPTWWGCFHSSFLLAALDQ